MSLNFKDPILTFAGPHLKQKVELEFYIYQLYLLGFFGVCVAAIMIVYFFSLHQALNELQGTIILLKAECAANLQSLQILNQNFQSLTETVTVGSTDPDPSLSFVEDQDRALFYLILLTQFLTYCLIVVITRV